NPHSVMFEVGWCVMLYTTVLFLEFLPLFFEKLRFEKPLRILRTITVPVVIVGVLLSTLHQSSLGTLYVIVPDKLHPLWYSGMLPLFFFISAIAGGLAMVIFESYLSARAFKKALAFPLLVRLSRVIVVVLGVWLVLRVQDLASRDALAYVFDGSRESVFFLLEVALGVGLPILMFLTPKIRNSMGGLYLGAVLVLIGFIMNRLNVAVTGMVGSSGVEYVPSWMEVAVTASIVAAGFVIFRLACRYLPIFSSDAEISHTPPLIAAGRSGSIAMGVLGVLLILIFIGIGFGYGNKGFSEQNVIQPAVPLPAGDTLTLPEAIKYEMGDVSPGQVTFLHETHVDTDHPNCKNCHQQIFPIRPEKAGSLSSVQMDLCFEKKQCGSCHDGENAFSVEDNCEACHVAQE
ncbi:polysulfide reductase NrfD, partial [candidate division KSB1 bacterium]|nr:polysulfide reductase NrfD [candidate division KSB1 bacterium]